MNKVLYISYDGMTDPLGQSQVIPYLEGLSREGFEITLLSCEKKIPFQKYQQVIAEQLALSSIQWQVVSYHKNPPILSTLFDLFKIRKLAYTLHKKETFEIIHCRSYISAFVGLWMKRKFGTRFIFDMRGFWADERVEGGIWNLENPIYKLIYRFFKHMEKDFLVNADHIVSLTKKGKDIIHSWQNIPGQPLPITVIPCCVDTDHFDPKKVKQKEIENVKEKLGIKPEDKILTYLGSLGTWYLVDDMLLYFKKLIIGNPEYKFLIITKDDHVIIKKKANLLEIPIEKFILTSSERKELPVLLSVSNLAISFIKPSFSKSASSPTKLGELLSMGIPVICNKGVGDVDYIFKGEFSVLLYSINETFLFSEKDFMNIEKKKLKEMIKRSFSLDLGINNYKKIYNSI